MTDFVCTLCPRRCGARRTAQTGAGFCRMPAAPMAVRAALHTGEEPCISGTVEGRGSGTVFFAGCSLRCAFCQNHEISRGPAGRSLTPAQLADTFRQLEQAGAWNINLVNPTHYAAAIAEALQLYRPAVPVVYNTGGYERVETLRQLEGLIDVYLPDLKYRSPALAAELSGAADYADYAAPAILEMARQTGPMQLDGQGMARRGTLVRHLVLPGHTKESLTVIDWLKEHLPSGVWVSLLFQYTPVLPVEGHPELARPLTRRECNKVWNYLLEAGLTDGYVQDLDSTGTKMIPNFDLTGIPR